MAELPTRSYDVSSANDPERCLASTHQGQCWMRIAPGSRYCPSHMGFNEEQKAKLRNYRLTKYAQRVNQFADSDVIKSLREEIGILRMLLEEILNNCQDSTDLLLYSSKIADLVSKVEHLVISCHRIENNLGFTMDKSTVLTLSSKIVNVISNNVSDPSIIDTIVNEISNMIETVEVND
jgi:hypothetical protein